RTPRAWSAATFFSSPPALFLFVVALMDPMCEGSPRLRLVSRCTHAQDAGVFGTCPGSRADASRRSRGCGRVQRGLARWARDETFFLASQPTDPRSAGADHLG